MADIDRDTFVQLLNEDLRTEYQSVIQYVHHIATIEGAEFLSVKGELRAHVRELEKVLAR